MSNQIQRYDVLDWGDVSPVVGGGLVTYADHAADKAAALATIEALVADIRSPWMALHMDGRNEHGTHLLHLSNCGASGIEKEVEDAGDELNEFIFREAEKMGHSDGHAIVTLWSAEYGEGYGSIYAYDRISEPLTKLMYGSPSDQADFITALLEEKGDG